MTLKFIKMHGLGNDFIVIDATIEKVNLTEQQRRDLANRRRGIGCDQLLVMKPAQDPRADIFMRIYNTDGSEAQACGNGTRCVAYLWMMQNHKKLVIIQSIAGVLVCEIVEDGMVCVDMGAPRLGWRDIPLAREQDTLQLNISTAGILPVAVNMGNPHAVFFVDDVNVVDLEKIGPSVERDPLFPQRTNVEFAQILASDKIRMRVWERGAGITQACGSGACATMVAAVRRGLSDRKAEIVLDGGSLFLEWRETDDHVLMTGPVTTVFSGEIALPL